MPLNARDIVLDSVTVRASSRAHATAAANDLRLASWPARSDSAWVFVRSISVSSRRDRAAEQAAAAAGEIVGRAVDGGTTAAQNADAVRFANFEQMLGWLLADLAAGRAQLRWYWRHWKRLFDLNVPNALESLLAEHAERMTTLIDELARTNSLAPVWRSLTPEASVRLLVELSRATRTSFFRPAPSGPPASAAPPDQVEASDFVTRSPHLPGIVQRWRAPLTGLDAQDPRVRLAAALVSLARFPIFLARDPCRTAHAIVGVLVTAFGHQPEQSLPPQPELEPRTPVSHESAPIAPAFPEQAVGFTPSAGVPRPRDPGREAAQSSKSPAPTREIPAASRELGRVENQSSFSTPPPIESAGHTERPPDPTRPTTNVEPPPVDSNPSPVADVPRFHTRQAGVFYLVNALNHPSVRSLLNQADAWTALPSGWAWLFRLGETLGLDLDDAVVLLMAREMGYTSVDGMRDLPELPIREPLLRLLETVYARFGIWQSDLLEMEGEVAYTASHVDIHMPMSAVRLPVRLAALDINPGWVPWLGRVVTFHYESFPRGVLQ